MLLFRDRSKGGKKSKIGKKKRQVKTERVNTAKSSREQVPTDLLPVLSLEGVALQLGPIAAGETRGPTSAGERRFLYSPVAADPAASARAESRAMSPGLRMLPRQRSHLRGAPAASLLHPNIYISCFLPGSI